ncbi:hypothetical protein C8J56DRAFT_903351 [Mycena floridula]|nr:hypothetical protein C8J56DRAFT_903351 [Mycena floridula]
MKAWEPLVDAREISVWSQIGQYGGISAVPALAIQKDGGPCYQVFSTTRQSYNAFQSWPRLKARQRQFHEKVPASKEQEAVVQRIMGAAERRMTNRLDNKAQTKPPWVFL